MKGRRLTHSSMTCAKTCLRKYYFRYVRGLVRQREETPLRVGSMVHKGLESDKDIVKAGYPSWCIEDEERHKWDCDFELAKAMVIAYREYWADDACEIEEVEYEFELPITNPETGGVTRSFIAAGKIDKVVTLPDGRLALLEHKTTTEDLDSDSTYWRRLLLDQQISHYMLAAQALGLKVETILYDVIRRPMLKPKSIPVLDENDLKIVEDENGDRVEKKAGGWRQSAGEGMTMKTRPETPEEYGERVLDDMRDKQDYYFCRREIPRLEADLEEFMRELWSQQKLLTECHNKEYWFRNTAACIHYQRPCDYFDICYEGLDVEDVPPLGYEFRRAHSELSAKGGKKS